MGKREEIKKPRRATLNEIMKRLSLEGGRVIYLSNGKEVAKNSKAVYKQVQVNNEVLYLHHVSFFLDTGRWPKSHIDHKDGNRHNNDPKNLRELGDWDNNRAFSSKRSCCSSKFRGVYFCNSRKKYVVKVEYKRKRKFVGRYDSEIEAAKAWNHAAQSLGYLPEALNEVPHGEA